MRTIKNIAFQLMIGFGILFIAKVFDHIIGIEQMNVLTLIIGFVVFITLLFKLQLIIKALGINLASSTYTVEEVDISIIFTTSGLILLVMTIF